MIAILISLMLTFSAYAADKTKDKAGATLDFKDQVIEGDGPDEKVDANGKRKNSPLFDPGKDDSSLDTIVFKRGDFNDFHDLQLRQHVMVQNPGGQ